MSGICTGCGLPEEICVCEDIAKEQQEMRISTDARRYGKLMTIVAGMDHSVDMKKLLSELKSKCACGGTVKDGHIELQGDHARKVKEVLAKMGYAARSD